MNLANKVVVGLLCAAASVANATPIELSWTTTLSFVTGSVPGTAGEAITTIITVDNGSSSLTNQTWTGSNFLSYWIGGASGWWAESSVLAAGSSFGSFSTDGSGNLISAGNWQGGYWTNSPVMTSWAGDTTGGWWNNGNNQVFCISGGADCVWANDVAGNLVASNWTARAVSESVPEPASIALMGLGLAGLGLSRRRATKQKSQYSVL